MKKTTILNPGIVTVFRMSAYAIQPRLDGCIIGIARGEPNVKVNESIIMIKWCHVIGQYQRNCRIKFQYKLLQDWVAQTLIKSRCQLKLK